MENDNKQSGGEDQDLNNKKDHDPVEAGKKAIEAAHAANDQGKQRTN